MENKLEIQNREDSDKNKEKSEKTEVAGEDNEETKNKNCAYSSKMKARQRMEVVRDGRLRLKQGHEDGKAVKANALGPVSQLGP